MNKIETTNFEKMYPILDKLNKYDFVKKFLTTSAIRKVNIDELEKEIDNKEFINELKESIETISREEIVELIKNYNIWRN